MVVTGTENSCNGWGEKLSCLLINGTLALSSLSAHHYKCVRENRLHRVLVNGMFTVSNWLSSSNWTGTGLYCVWHFADQKAHHYNCSEPCPCLSTIWSWMIIPSHWVPLVSLCSVATASTAGISEVSGPGWWCPLSFLASTHQSRVDRLWFWILLETPVVALSNCSKPRGIR